MRDPRLCSAETEQRYARVIVEATAELMRNLDEIESRLGRLETAIRARVARPERA